MSDTHLTEVASFTNLHLPEALARGIADAGFERCTPIQAQTLPKALAGLDVAGQAQTGTGKTAAFLVALYSTLLRRDVPADAPRQRAARADRRADARARGADPQRRRDPRPVHGADARARIWRRRLRKTAPHARAGRRRPDRHARAHHRFLQAARVRPAHVQVLVLDEADRMFDLGFIADIRYILRRLPRPRTRLNMLFSATLSQRVLELAYEHMNDPELVRDRAGQDDGRQCPPGRSTSRRWTRSRGCWSACCGPWTRIAPWCSSTRAAGPRSSSRCSRRTASTPRRSRATCRSASACACCATSTAATSPC